MYWLQWKSAPHILKSALSGLQFNLSWITHYAYKAKTQDPAIWGAEATSIFLDP